jgi:hypothetical protein
MPCKVVKISISTLPYPEPTAILLSELAFPKVREESTRFFYAVCQSAILTRAEEDRAWGLQPQRIKPLIFVGSTKIDRKIIRSGETKLNRLFQAGDMIAPIIIKHVTHREHHRFGRLARKIADLKRDQMYQIGWGSGSRSTFSSRIWRPSRPIIHVAAAYFLVAQARALEQEQEAVIYPRRFHDYLYCFESPKFLRDVLVAAEGIRAISSILKELDIKEEETIQFIPD